MKFMTLENLEQYHELLIEQVRKMIELHKDGLTNCPNCGAIISDETCPYCGTDFTKVFKRKDEDNGKRNQNKTSV